MYCSALEIVTKLCDVDFARRAKAADFLGRAWEVLREAGAGDGDKVNGTNLAPRASAYDQHVGFGLHPCLLCSAGLARFHGPAGFGCEV